MSAKPREQWPWVFKSVLTSQASTLLSPFPSLSLYPQQWRDQKSVMVSKMKKEKRCSRQKKKEETESCSHCRRLTSSSSRSKWNTEVSGLLLLILLNSSNISSLLSINNILCLKINREFCIVKEKNRTVIFSSNGEEEILPAMTSKSCFLIITWVRCHESHLFNVTVTWHGICHPSHVALLEYTWVCFCNFSWPGWSAVDKVYHLRYHWVATVFLTYIPFQGRDRRKRSSLSSWWAHSSQDWGALTVSDRETKIRRGARAS